MSIFKPFELDPFDLLWRDLLETQSHFSAITQKVTHPVDIYETEAGIRFEIAAVGLDEEDMLDLAPFLKPNSRLCKRKNIF